MKKLVLLILLLAVPVLMRAQETEPYYLYRIVSYGGDMKYENRTVDIDNGKSIEKLRDEKGKSIVFATPAGVVMYFVSRGWELLSHGITQKQTELLGNVYIDSCPYWVFRKPCSKEEFDKAVKDAVR